MEIEGEDGVQTSTALAVADRSPPRNQWKKKYLILKRKCDQIDQSNDVLYAKSRQIYKMIQRAETEKRVLMQRLEQYEVEFEDSHVATRFKISEMGSPPHSFPPSSLPSVFTSPTPDRSEPDLLQLKQDTVPPSSKPHPPTLTSLPTETNTNHHPPPPTKRPHLSTAPSSSSTPPSNKPAKKTPKSSARSSNRRKKDTDSNAPKKPSNAFFWFCQEQRGSLEEQFRGEGVAGQHSLTKILAQKWGETSADDKKKYYLKYTDDKKRYEREMQAYQLKKQEQQEQMQQQLAALAATNTLTTT